MDLVHGLPFQKAINVGKLVLFVRKLCRITCQLDIYRVLPGLQSSSVAIVPSWWGQFLRLGAGVCLLLSRGERSEGSIEVVNSGSFSCKIVSQGSDILLQSGNFVIGSLELFLNKEEVGPQLCSNLVDVLEDIDDFSAIGGEAIGVRGEGECSLGLKSCTRAHRYGSRVLGVHDSHTSWMRTIQRSVTGWAREYSWWLSYTEAYVGRHWYRSSKGYNWQRREQVGVTCVAGDGAQGGRSRKSRVEGSTQVIAWGQGLIGTRTRET